MDDDECGAVGGMIGKGNRSIGREFAPMTLSPPEIPYDLTPGSNPGLRGGKLATNRLIYGTGSTATNCWDMHGYGW
jgi:hypothetical protein